jgi:hypothetical protein
MLKSTFQNRPRTAEKVEKVILTRVVWLELLRTDHGVTEEGKPRNQMSHENEMIGRPARYFAGLPRSKLE